MAEDTFDWVSPITGDVWVEMWGGGYFGQDADAGGFGASGFGGGGGAYSRRKVSVVMGSTYHLHIVWNVLDSLTQFLDTDDSTSLSDVMNGGTAVNGQFPGAGAGGMLSGYDAEFSGGWGGNRTIAVPSPGGGGGAGASRTGDAPFPASSPPFPYNGQAGTIMTNSYGGDGGDSTPTSGLDGFRGGGGGGGGWSGAVPGLRGNGARGGISIYEDSVVFDPAAAVLIEAFGDVEPLPEPDPKLRKSVSFM